MQLRTLAICVCCAAVCWVLLPGCPGQDPLNQIGLRPGNEGFVNQTFGPERLVALTAGNIAEDIAIGAQGRIDALGSFLGAFQSQFGGDLLKADPTPLLAAAPEQEATFGESEIHNLVFLHQEHEGALVLDAVVYGDFVMNRALGGSQLRRVQGRLFPTASLPTPPAASREALGEATRQFNTYLQGAGMREGTISGLVTPAIWAAQHFAGFLLIQTENPSDIADTAQRRIAAVVNPDTNEIRILYNMDACHAGVGFGG